MKVTEKITIKSERVVEVRCDRCGKEAEEGAHGKEFDFFEFSLEVRRGQMYPLDGFSGEEFSLDCCKKCFEEAFLPALESAGFLAIVREVS